ncbi:MAG: hypothetical protein R3C14_42535 [Caldilineaceae bacterium]
MSFQLFTEIVEKLVSAAQSLMNLTKDERTKYREVLSETCRLLDTTLNMVIAKLGHIASIKDDTEFLKAVKALDNYEEWLRVEREIWLCQNLRATVAESETLQDKLTGKVSIAKWDELLSQMRYMLGVERDLARYINEHIELLVAAAQAEIDGGQPPEVVRQLVSAYRTSLLRERQDLIQLEVKILDESLRPASGV